MFEAVHGSAPDIANPSGLLNAAVLMLVHIGQSDVATAIKNAWLNTLEDGIHTADIFDERISSQKVGTDQFADAVIERLGTMPNRLGPAKFGGGDPMVLTKLERSAPAKKDLIGVDVYVTWRGQKPKELAGLLEPQAGEHLKLLMITNRGVKVYPGGFPETFRTDHWRGRFTCPDGGIVTHLETVQLLKRFANANIDFIKTEHLYNFDGKPGYSLGQEQ